MKILDSGAGQGAGGGIFISVLDRPFITSISQTDLAVGAGAAVVVGTPAAGFANTLFDLQNLSPAGQQLRVGLGVVPSIGGGVGKLLNPGDNYTIVVGSGLGGTGDVQAIATAAGGLLGRSILST
jgi:hypothetical protein